MNAQLEHTLCEKYPQMLVNRYKSPHESAMSWGFEIEDGWYNIINSLLQSIQIHMNWMQKIREEAIEYNKMAKDCKVGDFELFNKKYWFAEDEQYKQSRLHSVIHSDLRKVPDEIPPVIIEQVKEKFGTLRFYYDGGDAVVDGMVRMAEALSAVTCEQCGSPGHTREGRWIRSLCDAHYGNKNE
jgi:hypothetical protein